MENVMLNEIKPTVTSRILYYYIQNIIMTGTNSSIIPVNFINESTCADVTFS